MDYGSRNGYLLLDNSRFRIQLKMKFSSCSPKMFGFFAVGIFACAAKKKTIAAEQIAFILQILSFIACPLPGYAGKEELSLIKEFFERDTDTQTKPQALESTMQ